MPQSQKQSSSRQNQRQSQSQTVNLYLGEYLRKTKRRNRAAEQRRRQQREQQALEEAAALEQAMAAQKAASVRKTNTGPKTPSANMPANYPYVLPVNVIPGAPNAPDITKFATNSLELQAQNFMSTMTNRMDEMQAEMRAAVANRPAAQSDPALAAGVQQLQDDFDNMYALLNDRGLAPPRAPVQNLATQTDEPDEGFVTPVPSGSQASEPLPSPQNEEFQGFDDPGSGPALSASASQASEPPPSPPNEEFQGFEDDPPGAELPGPSAAAVSIKGKEIKGKIKLNLEDADYDEVLRSYDAARGPQKGQINNAAKEYAGKIAMDLARPEVVAASPGAKDEELQKAIKAHRREYQKLVSGGTQTIDTWINYIRKGLQLMSGQIN